MAAAEATILHLRFMFEASDREYGERPIPDSRRRIRQAVTSIDAKNPKKGLQSKMRTAPSFFPLVEVHDLKVYWRQP